MAKALHRAKRCAGLAACLSLFLGTCAYAGPDRDPLAQVWVTPKPLKAVEACVVKALDANGRTYSKISPSVRHVVKTLVPDEVVVVRPVKEHALADVSYSVRLEKIDAAITRMAFHSSEPSKVKKRTAEALSPCGTR